jgi:anti-anti-sigma regulatory factor
MAGAGSARNQDGDLRLLNLGKRVRDLLLITKLYSDFKVFDDEATAAQSFLNEPGGWSQKTEPGRSR